MSLSKHEPESPYHTGTGLSRRIRRQNDDEHKNAHCFCCENDFKLRLNDGEMNEKCEMKRKPKGMVEIGQRFEIYHMELKFE